MEIKVSVLILTHNRPELFKRCLSSVLKNKPECAEILVNNDTCDIEEVSGATYYYERNDDLSIIYNFLIDKAVGEYIYFLEDDDYVVSKFWDMVMTDISTKRTVVYSFIPDGDVRDYLTSFHNKVPTGLYNKSDFIQGMDIYKFQLSQVLFMKKDITKWMEGNNLDNDFVLFEGLDNDIYYNSTPIFTQTTDGKDNISYKIYCKDDRFTSQSH